MNTFKLPPGTWHIPGRPRIPDLPLAQQSMDQRLFLKITRRQAKAPQNLNVFVMLARLGNTFPRYLLFLSHILMKGKISRMDKERIILRVAWRVGCVYEWGHHAHMAQELGISRSEILSLASTTADGWDERLRALIGGVDDLVDHKKLSDETWSSLSRQLSDDQLVEFCMLVGHYIMVAGTINSVGVNLEPGLLDDNV